MKRQTRPVPPWAQVWWPPCTRPRTCPKRSLHLKRLKGFKKGCRIFLLPNFQPQTFQPWTLKPQSQNGWKVWAIFGNFFESSILTVFQKCHLAVFQKELKFIKKMSFKKNYRTRAIITRGLYICYFIFEDHFFVFKEFFFRKLCPCVWLAFKSGL